MEQQFDYVVIGAGPGGYSSAIRAAQLGLKTAIIEREHAGGVCLNWGCIPTKALLSSAHLLLRLREQKLGIVAEGLRAELPTIIDRSRAVAARLESGIKSLFKKYGVHFIAGEAKFASEHELEVSGENQQKIRFRNVCIATGARARPLPQLPFSARVWSYRDALLKKELPKSLLVIGGGAIGLEFADFYNCLDSQVVLVEAAAHILPAEDSKVATALRRALEGRGIVFYEGATITAAREDTNKIIVEIEHGGHKKTLEADAALVAIGVVPNTDTLGVEKFGILDERGFVRTDERLATAKPHIYAIGDVVPGKLLAHRAAHQGIFVAELLAGKNPMPPGEIPACIYTSPQVASIGKTEEELRKSGRKFRIGEFPGRPQAWRWQPQKILASPASSVTPKPEKSWVPKLSAKMLPNSSARWHWPLAQNSCHRISCMR